MKRMFFGLLPIVCFLMLGGSPAAQGATRRLAAHKRSHCMHPKWSPDGKLLAYEVHHIDKRMIQLHIYNWLTKKISVIRPGSLRVNGLELNSITEKRGMVSRELAWAPKKLGHKYLFSSNGNGTVYDLYLSKEGRLKVSWRSKNDGQPAWSPDGKRVVFTSARTGKGDLYWFNLKRMRPKRLTRNKRTTEFFAVWSPVNSRQIAYVVHTEQLDRIHVIPNIYAPRSRRLTRWRRSVLELNPAWSPDGKKIAFFTVDGKGKYDLYVSDLKGKLTKLASNVVKSDQYGPAWSPDGKKIFYVQNKDNTDPIYAVDVASRRRKKIKTKTNLNNELSVIKGSNGKWKLAFTAQGQGGNSSDGQTYRKLYAIELTPLP